MYRIFLAVGLVFFLSSLMLLLDNRIYRAVGRKKERKLSRFFGWLHFALFAASIVLVIVIM